MRLTRRGPGLFRDLVFLPVDRLRDKALRLVGVSPAGELHPFVGLPYSARRNARSAPCDFRQIGIISDVRVSLRQFWYRYGAPLSALQIFRSVVDDPAAGCARSAPAPWPPHRPGDADISIGADPELQRPPPNLPTTIPLKRNVDVGQTSAKVDTPGAGRDRPGSSTAAPGKTLKRKKPAPPSIQHTISRGCHPARLSNPAAPRQGIMTASASRKIG